MMHLRIMLNTYWTPLADDDNICNWLSVNWIC